jgi:UTP-glucose-1-phosphate uridylyltransferase
MVQEIQLIDGLKHLLRNRPIYGYEFEGTRYDEGDKLGFLKTTAEFALLNLQGQAVGQTTEHAWGSRAPILSPAM